MRGIGEGRLKAKDLGIAVVGSGRIGTLRARFAAKHPAVRFLAVSDKEPPHATLAELAAATGQAVRLDWMRCDHAQRSGAIVHE